SAHGTRCDLAECTFPGLLLPVGDQSDPVVLAAAQCHVGAVFQGDGQAQPAVVVGVFADQVHSPGCGPDSVRGSGERLLEGGAGAAGALGVVPGGQQIGHETSK